MSKLIEVDAAHPSGQMAVDNVANQIASFASAGVPGNGS